MAQEVEHLLCKHNVLSSNPVLPNEKWQGPQGLGHSQVKIWVTAPGEEPSTAGMLWRYGDGAGRRELWRLVSQPGPICGCIYPACHGLACNGASRELLSSACPLLALHKHSWWRSGLLHSLRGTEYVLASETDTANVTGPAAVGHPPRCSGEDRSLFLSREDS
jgi:hypothetical protein